MSIEETKTITDTFVRVSPDSSAEHSRVPISKNETKSVHQIQYELLTERPYYYTHEELIFQVHLRHKSIPTDDPEISLESVREQLFSKSHACLRASMLPKQYGWGVHYDAKGRIALYGMESPEYSEFLENNEDKLTIHNAMRNKRASK
ncbi:hypothetical protein EHS13_03115 [Paenibacillus psychroresistens]|uniref:Uncharacterized protein n=1 Tax=Paenibacillus psychroresistens TaxID=1778678 RepID=A0A6B8RF33_9BACL|nr:DUF6157 family protein [Paenibacillus psychroresistens]QGQ93966.1 hypothetical protein EHS13_03115 [Paenibacillus psychroresistens]